MRFAETRVKFEVLAESSAESAGFWGFFVLDSANFAESALFLRLDSAFFAESALFSAPRRSLSLSLSLVAFHLQKS
ncbi:hypothetical protein [Helicobacter sp. 23-1045]